MDGSGMDCGRAAEGRPFRFNRPIVDEYAEIMLLWCAYFLLDGGGGAGPAGFSRAISGVAPFLMSSPNIRNCNGLGFLSTGSPPYSEDRFPNIRDPFFI